MKEIKNRHVVQMKSDNRVNQSRSLLSAAPAPSAPLAPPPIPPTKCNNHLKYTGEKKQT